MAEAVTTAADAAGVKLDASNSANLTAAATGRDGDTQGTAPVPLDRRETAL